MAERSGSTEPTIHDVAEAVGVNASTVSRAFSRPERVNAATRERILATAERMGYRPSPIARALPSGRTTTLGLLVPDITNPFFFDLIRGAEREAAAAGFTLVLADTEESADAETRVLDRLSRSVDGFVLAAPRSSDAAIQRQRERRPLVTVNRRISGIPHVLIDTGDGVRQAAEHLASLGHRRIGYVAGPRTSWSDGKRWRGLQAVAKRRDLELERIGPNEPTLAAGPAAADACLLAGVSAVVAFNDLLAIGVVQRLQARGVEVPRDVSVVGSDDIFGAELCHPRLTTLAAPIESAGRAAVRMVLAGPDTDAEAAPANVNLPTRLEIRDSTGPAPVHRRGARHTPTQPTD